MMQERLTRLTNALYKVTGLFAEKEPLKAAIRKQALDIVFFCLSSNKENLQKGIDSIKVILAYLELAREQKWADDRNFLILIQEYKKLAEEIEQEVKKSKASKKHPEEKPVIKKEISSIEKELVRVGDSINYEALSDTQLKVLELLQNKGQLKPTEINGFFPGISPRSIRRELKELKEKNIIAILGSGKAVSYHINSV